jgi:hypothetical protein
MTDTHRSSGRRTIRVGPVGLVIEPDAPFDQIAGWLPHTDVPDGEPPAAAISVHREARPAHPTTAPSLVVAGLRIWVSSEGDRATALASTGHAQIDLRARLARLDPGTNASETHALLSATVSLVLAHAGIAVVRASAVTDAAGWCWLLLGEPCHRATATRAFSRGGGYYVSDGRALVRRAPLSPDVIVVESWHESTAAPTTAPSPDADRAELPWQRWRPLAPLRGVLLLDCSADDGAPLRRAAEASVHDALARAMPYVGADPAGDSRIAGLVAACAQRIAFHMPGDYLSPDSGDALLQALSAALEDHAL